MEIAKKEKDGVMIVSLIVINENQKLLIDLSDLEYISSAGLRALLVTAKRIRKESGKMCLCGLKENVMEVFEISGFSAIFDSAVTEEEALSILNN